MEPTIHPLLSLVESNRNGLKSLLTHYIDDTVDYQFDQLKNTLLKMILKGLINPLYEDTDENDEFTPFTQTNCPTYQANFDHENSSSSNLHHHSNEHLTYEQNILTESADVPDKNALESKPNASTQVNSSNNEQCPLISVNENADMQIGFGHDEIEQDQQNVLLENEHPLVISDVIFDDTNQSDSNTNDLSILINKSEGCSNQKANTITNRQNGQSAQPVNSEHIQQSIPSTSTGLRSSDRKRIQRKLFGDVVVYSNDEIMEGYKRKSVTQSSKKEKKLKHLEEEDEEVELEEVDDKFQVVTLKVNCTETGCKRILTSLELWKQHLSNFHGKIPYKHLRDNVRLTQHGQTEYACTDCAAAPKSQYLLSQHWRRHHLAGKFQCSVCEFVGNFWGKVWNHYQKAHFAGKFRCTQEGCNQTFKSMPHLVNHQRIHTGETPYKCTWHNCQVSFNQIGSAIKHVRTKHFHLPRTVREQKELNIIDERDPKMYVQVSRG